jgi:arsenite/tail-anchored protein-transporting ATPase
LTSRFVFFGGKGGVGKTTCASAFALAARRHSRVLLVSTDPAHSLSDAFDVRLSASPRPVADGLDAAEIDAPRAFRRWIREHRRPLGDVLEHGTWLDRDDVDALLDLSIPGVDELVGLAEISRFAERRGGSAYDLIVVDTAPTGHTLRLLAAPDTVAALAAILDSLQEHHRIIRDRLARVGRPEASDRFVALLTAEARDAASRLRNASETTFQWVTLPEALSLAETEDGVAALGRSGLRVTDVVVNRVLPDGHPCPLCDRRRREEHRVIAEIGRRLGAGRTVHLVAARLREPRGIRALASLGRDMVDGSSAIADSWKRPSLGRHVSSAISRQTSAVRPQPSPAMETLRGASLLFFGGKGGVGKTTVSAAVALRLAAAEPERRVLLLSTDPAHSLGDVLQATVADRPRTIARMPSNLIVRELDAAGAFASRRAQIEAALDEIASSFGRSAVSAGSGPGSDLMSLAPPGIDELFGVLSVIDARAAYDLIVVDTAPTGHALRLLETPEAAREWTQVLLRVLLKYKAIVRPGQLAAEIVNLSKSIRDLREMLRDPCQARFIVVTRAAAVPRLETARLLARLRRLRLSAPALVVNALTPAPGSCARCRATAAAERIERAALRRLCGRRCAIIETPLAAPPPRGLAQLNAWADQWLAPAQPASSSR